MLMPCLRDFPQRERRREKQAKPVSLRAMIEVPGVLSIAVALPKNTAANDHGAISLAAIGRVGNERWATHENVRE